MLEKRFQKAIVWAVTLIVMIILGGCKKEKTVIITYQPLVNAKYIPGNVATSYAGDGKIWMIYCISRIKNTGSDAINFQFDINRLYVSSENKLEPSYWPWTAESKSVAAHTTEYNLGKILIRADMTGMPNEGQQAWVQLHYSTVGEESIVMVQYPNPPLPQFQEGTLSQNNIPICYDGQNIP